MTAIANLCQLAWPAKLGGARQRDGGRVLVIATGDGLASSRLLHPDQGPAREPLFDELRDARFEWAPFVDHQPTLQL